MKKFINSEKLYDNLIWILLVSFLVMIAGDVIGLFIIPKVAESNQFLYTFIAYFSFITMWISVILAVTVFKKNHYIKESILMNKEGNTVKFLLMGFIIGFLLNIFSAFVAYTHGDIALKFTHFEILPVLVLFFAVFIQSSAEEVLCRGFMYQRLLHANFKPLYAVVINAAFFGVLHLSNDGISFLAFYDLFITGVFFSLIVFYFDSLWMAMAIHTTWNFTQSILLGLPNSGTSFPYTVFSLDTNSVHNSFAYNVEFGLEGTILSSIVMTFCCILLYVLKNNQKKIY
ncbi:hypothetical protein SAMN05421767_10510 [Granulicatella balaenopterae]|uniref:CAAX prenyl protease 2/Lysostaphin resistance protein A-like domain-containing protein n=1 Tax=Granulicatella balaenopterae TaxID=137733 RepID=A0A1H9I9Q0_9LACT|nr:type II CAAX endopeptidase family protein [Granulicatella balaenopterae]SEQ71276.1 hypothetical protein SAMN05421767_10510 [Granulicatella balaenopterae]